MYLSPQSFQKEEKRKKKTASVEVKEKKRKEKRKGRRDGGVHGIRGDVGWLGR